MKHGSRLICNLLQFINCILEYVIFHFWQLFIKKTSPNFGDDRSVSYGYHGFAVGGCERSIHRIHRKFETGITYVWPPPRIPVVNEGLVPDRLMKNDETCNTPWWAALVTRRDSL